MRTIITSPAPRQAIQAPVLLAQLATHVITSASDMHPQAIAAIVRVCCPHITDAGERARLWDEYLDAVAEEHGTYDGLIGSQRSAEALEALTGRQS